MSPAPLYLSYSFNLSVHSVALMCLTSTSQPYRCMEVSVIVNKDVCVCVCVYVCALC